MSRAFLNLPADTRALTSIPGAVVELRLSRVGCLAWRETEAQGAAVPPGDGDFEVGEPGVDEDGVLAAQVTPPGVTCKVPVASRKCRQILSGVAFWYRSA